MKIKNLLVLTILMVGVICLSTIVSALQAEILKVELDEDDLDPSSMNTIRSLDKGDEFEVKVHVKALADIEDAQIEAELRGYDYDDRVEDITDVFDMKNGTTYVKKLNLRFPQRMDQDRYKLRVFVTDRASDTLSQTYELEIETARHQVIIRDVVLSPSNGVVAGRALLATIRVRNYGKTAEEDVKVTFSIPELGISASDYIDELEADDEDKNTKSSEELYLRIPPCNKAGTYDAEVEVSFHDGEKTVTKQLTVEVLADEACEVAPPEEEERVTGKITISIGPESQDVTRGAGGVIYPVTITNDGKTAKTYIISVTGGDWGTFKVNPSNVVTVAPGKTETVYIYASANANAPAGQQVFGVVIKEGDQTVKEVTLKANVVGGAVTTYGGLKRALEIGLIVLVVILVILGLIIGFRKLKDEDEGKEEGESYY